MRVGWRTLLLYVHTQPHTQTMWSRLAKHALGPWNAGLSVCGDPTWGQKAFTQKAVLPQQWWSRTDMIYDGANFRAFPACDSTVGPVLLKRHLGLIGDFVVKQYCYFSSKFVRPQMAPQSASLVGGSFIHPTQTQTHRRTTCTCATSGSWWNLLSRNNCKQRPHLLLLHTAIPVVVRKVEKSSSWKVFAQLGWILGWWWWLRWLSAHFRFTGYRSFFNK